MRKLKITIIVIIFVLLFSPIAANGAYGVSVGDTFRYTVKTSSWSATHGSNSDSVSKYRLFFDSYSVGTDFDVNVTNVLADEVEYNITTSTEDYSWSDDMVSFRIYFLLFLFQPYLDANYIASGWPTFDFENGLPVQFWFFFDTDASTFDYFNNWMTTSVLSEYSTHSGWEDTHIEAHFDDTGAVAIFDWIIEGSLIYTSPYAVDIDGYFQLTLAFDKAIGYLQGYKYETNFKGTVEGDNYISETEQEVHLTSYSVPDYYFTLTGNYVPGFKWYVPFLVFSSMLVVSIIIRKRK